MSNSSSYVVRKHKGRSGKSVYEWRVYRVIRTGVEGTRIITTQLAKYRTQEFAERAAEQYRTTEAAA